MATFDQKYASNIAGIAKANNVDMGVAKNMLISNLTQGGQYKGGGQVSGNDWKSMQADARTLGSNPGSSTSTPSSNPSRFQSMYNALGSQPANTFSMVNLQNVMNGQTAAGGADIPVQQARFQTPEQLSSMLDQMNQVLSPFTQAQKNAATVGYNQAQSNLDNKWAARGMLNSGAAAAQQREGANALGGQLATIDAQQQANAFDNALKYADLGLNENNQLFNQQMQNRQFDLNRSQQGVSNMLQALGLQRQQNQDYMGNLQNINQLAENARQFDQTFPLKQAEVTGQYLPNGAQNLISQLINLKQQAENPANASQLSSFQSQGDQIRNQLAALGVNPNLFGSNVNATQAANNMSKAFTPTLQAQQIFGQSPNGTPTLQAQQILGNLIPDILRTMPTVPSGLGNVLQNSPALSGLSGVLNNMGGQQNSDTFNTAARIAQEAKQLGFEEQKWNEAGKQAMLSDTEYKNMLKDKGIDENNARKATSSAMAEILAQSTPEDAMKYINDNATGMSKAGVNIGDLYKILAERWPDKFAPNATKGIDPNKQLQNNNGSLLNP